MSNPQISVIMPNYNCASFLGEALESVLRQTFSNFEFIIIDDGSTDNSWEIIQAYAKKDSRIVALKNEKNLRICQTLNKGVEAAKGEYIARMDSDDVAHPDWLEKTLLFMEKPENKKTGICGANFFMIDGQGKKIGKKIFPETDEECRKAFWKRNPFAHNTVLIRKECFREFGNYDDNFIYAEDLELWMRFGQKYVLHNVQEYLVDYRVSGENSTLKKQKKMIESTLKARRKAWRDYGYKISLSGIVFYVSTWMAQWLPPKLVFLVFNFFKK